jgi:hypothetical protein
MKRGSEREIEVMKRDDGDMTTVTCPQEVSHASSCDDKTGVMKWMIM